MKYHEFIYAIAFALILSCSHSEIVNQTRGIGVYPGNAEEYTGPVSVIDKSHGNIALRKAAYHSSSYDYNLTANLVTDGIISDNYPYFLEIFTNDGPVSKRERELLFDDNFTAIKFNGGENAFLLLHGVGGFIAADSFELEGSAAFCKGASHKCTAKLEGSADGEKWDAVDSDIITGDKFSLKFEIPTADRELPWYRIVFESLDVETITLKELNFVSEGREVSPLPSYRFTSCWMSEGTGDEWIYVDFGAVATFDKILLHWRNKGVEGSIQVSDNAKSWREIAVLPGGAEDFDEIAVKGKGRYLRVNMSKSIDGGRYILDELEVMGTGALAYAPQPQQLPADGVLNLQGGGWKLQRASEVNASGETISNIGFDDSKWVIATVPGTVATSYFNIGAIPDIRHSDDQLHISESFFYSDFWYRDTFSVQTKGKYYELVFDGINWKGDVYFNGTYLGLIEGAYIRSRFDVTSLVREAEENCVAVLIHRNDHPGIVKEQTRISADVNGGILGADNPTFHATIGWDWIPTVRGRNIGIWNDVKFVSKPDMVTIDDVFVTTDLPLPSTDYADIYASVQLTNHSSTTTSAGRINVDYGGLRWSKQFEIAPNQSIELALDPAKLKNPKLWWPAGYGEPYLYDVEIQCVIDDTVVDLHKFKSGVRKMSYTTDNNILDLYINGRRLICNGGNWGYPEINLNYREREYDIAVAYHADMNFTMIRNWVGMTGDEEFFEACDRHGVMIWQDFWLANPWDGPDPDDEAMFCRNATDFVKRIRNHPSVALYVGRNEGYPPASLNSELEKIVNKYHPGIFYIPNSADDMVSGHGPYRALPVDEYFGTLEGRNTLHSERGMPNVMTAESMRLMLDEKDWWPQTSIWGIHDYTMENAQSCATFNAMVANAFGESSGLDEFASWAQWINYDGYRAMFESRSWNRKGLLIWMSHSCWPSMVWQTYDYYFEPTAAYFGAKKGSAPIRIQWNPISKNVEVVNNNASDMDGLTANVKILTYHGKELYSEDAHLDSKEDSTTPIMPLSFDIEGITNTYLIKLTLKQGDMIVADNFYVESLDGKGNYKELLSLPKAALSVGKEMKQENGVWNVDVTISNDSDIPAYMVRLKTIGSKSGERILPVFYQDNYFSLLPGEKKIVKIHFKQEDCRGEQPEISIGGFNVQ